MSGQQYLFWKPQALREVAGLQLKRIFTGSKDNERNKLATSTTRRGRGLHPPTWHVAVREQSGGRIYFDDRPRGRRQGRVPPRRALQMLQACLPRLPPSGLRGSTATCFAPLCRAQLTLTPRHRETPPLPLGAALMCSAPWRHSWAPPVGRLLHRCGLQMRGLKST